MSIYRPKNLKDKPMKNSLISFKQILIVCAAFVLVGCLSAATPVTYEHDAPPEMTSTVRIAGFIKVKSIDGNTVNWKLKFGDSWIMVDIPSGQHHFVMDYSRVAPDGKSKLYSNDINFTYYFAPGRSYRMYANEGFSMSGYTLDIVVDDITNK